MVPEQHIAGEPARDYALRMARDKAVAVSSRFPEAIVIGADTIVVCETQILEKPADAADARRMLAMLSARTHIVITAFALARDGKITREFTGREPRHISQTQRRRNRALHRHRRAIRQGRRLRNPGRRRRIHLARRRIARQRDGPADGARVAALARYGVKQRITLSKMLDRPRNQRAADDRASAHRRRRIQGGARRLVNSARAREQDAAAPRRFAPHGEAGARDFGENYVQEAIAKRAELTDLTDIRWHLIGHLQTNKAKTAASAFALIHSVDSVRLAEALARAQPSPRVHALIEVNLGAEASKTRRRTGRSRSHPRRRA